MNKLFSIKREFDFVRLDGLRRATGRPPHEWDIYIIKELLDNALDADEVIWQHGSSQYPAIHVHIEYIPVPELRSQQLLVAVGNRAEFPVNHIQDIFNTGWYTSRKAFMKGITRGALGNALKTLLGIAYVLRHRSAGDWEPTLKALSIQCADQEYTPKFLVDNLGQDITLECACYPCRPIKGTRISLGIDNFQQEQPRTIEEIIVLAQQYHVCNPHAYFSWSVTINDQEWQQEYQPVPHWTNKFLDTAPVHWYSPAAFQEMLSALYRNRNGDREDGTLSLEDICRCFITSNYINEIQLGAVLGKKLFTFHDITGQTASDLYRTLLQIYPTFDAAQLGAIGADVFRTTLAKILDIEGPIFYQCQTSNNDPSTPFVLEVAIAYLKTGKRQVWTAINFSPTYDDPLQNRYLSTPLHPEDRVLGLRGFLEAYALTEDTPIVVFLHLVCPSIEHHNFSKTEINHLPFKETLEQLLHGLFIELQRSREAEDLQLEQTICRLVDNILQTTRDNERFVLSQLVEQVRLRLRQEPQYAEWLRKDDTLTRLQSYVTTYLNKNTTFAQSIARPAMGMLTIPVHPDHHFFLSTHHVSQEILTKHPVNKIIYLQERELESVAIENNWLCQMDMALLHNPQNPEALRDVLMQCLLNCTVPLLLWHNADEPGLKLAQQIQTWLSEQQLANRCIDLGLGTSSSQEVSSIIAMMPHQQVAWLTQRFAEVHIPQKYLPSDEEIRQDMSKRLEQLFLRHFIEHFEGDIYQLFAQLNHQLQITQFMINQQLDIQVKQQLQQVACQDTYDTVIKKRIEAFFLELLSQHGTAIQQFMGGVSLITRNSHEHKRL